MFLKSHKSKCLPNSFFKRSFNCMPWHPCLYILVKKVEINFLYFYLEVVLGRSKISDPTAALKILVDILLSRPGILTIEKLYVSLLLYYTVSSYLCPIFMCKSRNEVFRFYLFSFFNTNSGGEISLKSFSNTELLVTAQRSSIKENVLANFLAFS